MNTRLRTLARISAALALLICLCGGLWILTFVGFDHANDDAVPIGLGLYFGFLDIFSGAMVAGKPFASKMRGGSHPFMVPYPSSFAHSSNIICQSASLQLLKSALSYVATLRAPRRPINGPTEFRPPEPPVLPLWGNREETYPRTPRRRVQMLVRAGGAGAELARRLRPAPNSEHKPSG